MEFTDKQLQQALDLKLPANDAKAETVREYLTALLTDVWFEEEGFDGKRPFGNSGWQEEIYVPLAHAGLINASADRHGELEYIDYTEGEALILAAIGFMGRKEMVNA